MPQLTEGPATEPRATTSIEESAATYHSRILCERGCQEFKPDGTMFLGCAIDQLRTHPVFTKTVGFWFEEEGFQVEDSCAHGTHHVTLTTEHGENRKLATEVIEDSSVSSGSPTGRFPCARSVRGGDKPARSRSRPVPRHT